jgi:hypothetical protein
MWEKIVICIVICIGKVLIWYHPQTMYGTNVNVEQQWGNGSYLPTLLMHCVVHYMQVLRKQSQKRGFFYIDSQITMNMKAKLSLWFWIYLWWTIDAIMCAVVFTVDTNIFVICICIYFVYKIIMFVLISDHYDCVIYTMAGHLYRCFSEWQQVYILRSIFPSFF